MRIGTDKYDTQVADLSTSKSTPAPHADTQQLRFDNVRYTEPEGFVESRAIGTGQEEGLTNMELQTTGARRPSAERPLVQDACAT